MPKVFVLFIFYYILMFTISCKSQSLKYNENITSFVKFPKEIHIGTKEYLHLDDVVPDELYLYRDSLLLMINMAEGQNYHFSLYNVHTKKFLFNLLNNGGKLGSSLGFLSFGIVHGKLWVNDVMKKKIIFNNIDNMLLGKEPEPREIPLSKFYYSSQVINDSIMLCSGDYSSDYKISKYNLLERKITMENFPYQSDSTNVWDRALKSAYESFLYVHPGGQKSALAARYTDKIEIFNLSDSSSKIIVGPEKFEPNVKKVKDNSGNVISTPSRKTKLAFVRGHVTDKFIYLLYSGNNEFTQNKDYGKNIFVYDWEGNPVKKLVLKDFIVDFAVTQDDRIMYSYNPETKNISISKL